MRDDELHGRIVQEDRFGNLITNIDRRTFEKFIARHAFTIAVTGGERGDRRSAASSPPTPRFADDEVCALFGSGDHLELAARSRRAASARSGSGAGAAVVGHDEAR